MEIVKLIHKPTTVTAVKFIGSPANIQFLKRWMGKAFGSIDDNNELHVITLEDGENDDVKHIATVGDYIIKGKIGEFWPIKPKAMPHSYKEKK